MRDLKLKEIADDSNRDRNKLVHWKHLEQAFLLMAKEENDLLLGALRDYLGHEPGVEDNKRCMLIHHQGNFMQYQLRYDGKILGTIMKECPWPNFKGYNVQFVSNNLKYDAKENSTRSTS